MLGFIGINNCLKPVNTFIESSGQEDNDVRIERARVSDYFMHGLQLNPIVVIQGLRRVYKKSFSWLRKKKDVLASQKVAVANLSLLIEPGEIFGLLGPNGAGKTTTIRVLTADETRTEGRVELCRQAVQSSLSNVGKEIGYCPQQDALWPKVTLREHLRLYARIRGCETTRIDDIIQTLMSSLKIEEHAEMHSEDLSGGTKRKLCFAISLLGRPRLLLLDEPSTGMDPQAKRFLWDTILGLFQQNRERAVVLTTHAMEEVEALCTRTAIMVRGVMRCLGNLTHLKNLYGSGYLLEVKWDVSRGPISDLKAGLNGIFGVNQYVIKSEFADRMTIAISQAAVKSLANVFSALNDLVAQPGHGLVEFSFGQNTFEQVFIEFAKDQEESLE